MFWPTFIFLVMAAPPLAAPSSWCPRCHFFKFVALLRNCSETSAPPVCPLGRPAVAAECLLASLPMAGVETNDKQRARTCIQVRACACVCVSLPPRYDTVTADPGHSAIMADEAGLPWQRLVARWRDITAGLCNNLS